MKASALRVTLLSLCQRHALSRQTKAEFCGGKCHHVSCYIELLQNSIRDRTVATIDQEQPPPVSYSPRPLASASRNSPTETRAVFLEFFRGNWRVWAVGNSIIPLAGRRNKRPDLRRDAIILKELYLIRLAMSPSPVEVCKSQTRRTTMFEVFCLPAPSVARTSPFIAPPPMEN